MPSDTPDEVIPALDLSRRLRRLRFFDEHFQSSIRTLATRIGLSVTIDHIRLTEAFLAWGENLTRQREASITDQHDFMLFSAGVLLTHLIQMKPLVIGPIDRGDPEFRPPEGMEEIIVFWPEGFLYTSYCVSVLQSVFGQHVDGTLPVAEIARDLRSWWSFRENVREESFSAVGFLDLFVGAEPNFDVPSIATSRPAMRRTADARQIEAVAALSIPFVAEADVPAVFGEHGRGEEDAGERREPDANG